MSTYPVLQMPTQAPVHFHNTLAFLTPLNSAHIFPTHHLESPIKDRPKTRKETPNFLVIPLELRELIYGYVLADYPIRHAHLSPVLTARPGFSASAPYTNPTNINPGYGHGLSYPSPGPISTINPLIIQGKIPTALLLTNRQVYHESRLLPFQQNHFTFVNWFRSGVYAARQFSRGLASWQRNEMRWVGIEVLGRDLWSVGNLGAGNQEWEQLCEFWKGIKGLRLAIRGPVYKGRGKEGELSFATQPPKSEQTLLDAKLPWIQKGLLQMENLHLIELEIADEDASREGKLAFCVALASALGVKVLFTEKIKDEAKFSLFGGELL